MNPDQLKLVECDEKLLEIILKGDSFLAKKLDVYIPVNWCTFGREIFEFTLQRLKENPSNSKWYVYLPIDMNTRTLIGTCGFKGAPNEDGMVEIGYEVAKELQNKGLATIVTSKLIKLAFEDKRVTIIQAHTQAEKNASVRVLEKCNFKFVKEIIDDEDGLIWTWTLEK